MATIAAINTNFTATTGNFEKGSKRVEKMAAGLGARIRGNLSAAIPGFGQLVSTAAIGILVKRAADAFKKQFDELGNLMDQSINLSTPIDQLQSLRFAASQAGVSAEQLDAGLARMKRQLPGVSIEQLADVFKDTTDATKKLQFAHAVFGKSGVRLISTLSGGSRSLDEAKKKFAELGGTLTDFDVASADEAGDALDRVGVAFDNLGKQLAVNAAPGVTLFANALAEVTGGAANAVRGQFALAASYLEVEKSIGNWVQRAGETFGIFEEGPQRAGNLLQGEWDKIIRGAEEAAERARELRGAVGSTAEDAEKKASRRAVEPAAVEVGTTAAIEAINKAAGGGHKKEEKEAVKELKGVNKNLAEVKRAIEKIDLEPADIE